MSSNTNCHIDSRVHQSQLQATCLPITALHTVVLCNTRLILAGQGSCLTVYEDDGSQLSKTRVFESQAIHGLLSTSNAELSEDGSESIALIVWGGREICSIKLTYNASTETVWLDDSSRCTVPSWILRVANSTVENRLYLLTAHNNVEIASYKSPLESTGQLVFEERATGARSFLYSGDIQVIEPGFVLVAAGTVFGEVLVWSATKDTTSFFNVKLRHVFVGHNGSVFGTRLSPHPSQESGATKYLATCSDDRTIRVWDISDCSLRGNNHPPQNTSVVLSTTTGFGNSDKVADHHELALAWGHLSRIWDVAFLSAPIGIEDGPLLATRGEDGACQIWALDAANAAGNRERNGKETTLRSVGMDRLHAGKNAWSWTMFDPPEQMIVLTGGADGRIASRSVSKANYELKGREAQQPVPFSVLLRDVAFGSGASGEMLEGLRFPKTFKQYVFLTRDILLTCTDSGTLLSANLSQPGRMQWSVVPETGLNAYSIICGTSAGGLVFAFTSDGTITAIWSDGSAMKASSCKTIMAVSWTQVAYVDVNAPPNTASACIVVVGQDKVETKAVWISLHDCVLTVQSSTITLPPSFVVTAACHYPEERSLLLGSRAGALAVYHAVDSRIGSCETWECHRHVHGSDSVTSLIIVPRHPSPQATDIRQDYHVLSTGRDGTFAIHKIPTESAEAHNSFTTVHRSTPPFGPNIEGAYWKRKPNNINDLVLYGFKSTEFTAWNETQQETIFNIECGGAHRSWAFHGAISELDDIGCFVWTKTSSFNVEDIREPRCKMLTAGGHGRETKALATMPVRKIASMARFHLIATGSEDTDVRLFKVPAGKDSDSAFVPVLVLRGHNTGLQHLEFSSCGEFLFSSGGREELFIWKFTYDVPTVEIGVVLLDKVPLYDEDADTRILSFDVLESCPGQGDTFVLLIAYSNGTARLLTYTPSQAPNQGQFNLLRTIEHGAFCLTQAHILTYEEPQTNTLLTAGTNGHLNIWSCTHSQSKTSIHQIHQNSIAALKTVQLDQTHWLVLTGGDDNALGLTFVTLDSSPASFRSMLIPKAHAAALTALVAIHPSSTPTDLIIITAGNDQKIKVWHVQGLSSIQTLGEAMEEVIIENVDEMWTDVADVSEMRVLQSEATDTEMQGYVDVLVVGVGMEVCRVKITDT